MYFLREFLSFQYGRFEKIFMPPNDSPQFLTANIALYHGEKDTQKWIWTGLLLNEQKHYQSEWFLNKVREVWGLVNLHESLIEIVVSVVQNTEVGSMLMIKVTVFHALFTVCKPQPRSKQSREKCVSSVSRQMQMAYFITAWLMFQFPDLVLIKRK